MRLGRLRDRNKHEENSLERSERDALSKVFYKDIFTEAMMNIRQVAEHVSKRGTFVIRTPNNASIPLAEESVAMAVFSASTVRLDDVEGKTHRLDHLTMLEEMKNRIAAAIRKAKL